MTRIDIIFSDDTERIDTALIYYLYSIGAYRNCIGAVLAHIDTAPM